MSKVMLRYNICIHLVRLSIFTSVLFYAWPSMSADMNGVAQYTTDGCAVMGPNIDPNTKLHWTGNCVDGHTTGYGILTADGPRRHDRYVGEMNNGMMNGSGTIYFPDGTSITSAFRNNNTDGPVLFKSMDNSTYAGEWKKGPEGLGTKVYANSAIYAGYWHDGLRSGLGVLQLSDGSKYVGGFLSGKYNGMGTLKTSAGDTYTGNWVLGSLTGHSEITTHDGLRFEGDVIAGQRDGLGKLSAASGENFEGAWKSDLPNGVGTLKNVDGRVYTGNWVNGCLRVENRWLTAFVDSRTCGH